MQLRRAGFTLIELLVVVGMITVIMGAVTTSFTAARRRAQIQKATNDVKVIAQAILASENYKSLEDSGGWQIADKSNLSFLFGKEQNKLASGGQIPVLISTALNGSGQILDPWGRPYEFKITAGGINIQTDVLKSGIRSGFALPNFYRISEGER